jgi:hypothetical protein
MYMLLRQIQLHLCYALLPLLHTFVFDDNESEIILGDLWDKSESRGVKSVLLGSTRYHSCVKSLKMIIKIVKITDKKCQR